uniref:Transmembrane protein 230 n=1 Tax=Urocitellus parryii TaxID=9999 RepID=A0A8D2HGG5_UROPR
MQLAKGDIYWDPFQHAGTLCSLKKGEQPRAPSRATGIPSSKVKYSRLSKKPPKIPYKVIALATVLFLIGAFPIISGSVLLSGYISKVGSDQAVPVLIIGILVFLPGFYHQNMAHYVSKGYKSYYCDVIPNFDD